MGESERKTINTRQGLLHSLVGALAAGLGFIPLTFISAAVLKGLFDLLDVGRVENVDDYLVISFCWLPAVGLGALGGLVGSDLARKKFKRIRTWIGAVIGGLIASLIIAFLMNGEIYAGWIATDKEYRTKETQKAEQAKSNQQIPFLVGKFQEITTENEFDSLAINPDGKLLAVAANHQIILWDIEQNTVTGQINTGDIEPVTDLKFSSDGNRLVTLIYLDHKLMVWSVPDEEQSFVLEVPQGSILHMAVSPSENLVASGDNQGIVIIWDLTKGKEVERLKKYDHNYSLDFSPDGKVLAISTGQSVLLWDVVNQKSLGSLDMPKEMNDPPITLSFSPDGSLLAGIIYQQGVVIWDMKSKTPLGVIQNITCLAIDFSPDGNYLVLSNDSGIYIYDAVTQAPVGKLRSFSDYYDALYLPNGKLLAWYESINGPTKIGLWTIEIP